MCFYLCSHLCICELSNPLRAVLVRSHKPGSLFSLAMPWQCMHASSCLVFKSIQVPLGIKCLVQPVFDKAFYSLCKKPIHSMRIFITACCLSSLVPFSFPNSQCNSGQCISAEENLKKNGCPSSCYNGFEIFPQLIPVSI